MAVTDSQTLKRLRSEESLAEQKGRQALNMAAILKDFPQYDAARQKADALMAKASALREQIVKIETSAEVDWRGAMFRRSPETKDEDSRTARIAATADLPRSGPATKIPAWQPNPFSVSASTAMVLLLVIAAAAAQTTSTPLYVDGVLRVVATFHRINERSLPVSGLRD